MRNHLSAIGAALVALSWGGTAQAQSLPQPVIEGADQAQPLIYDEQVSKLDYNGRFVLDLVGRNLGPDDSSHPGGFRGGYVHLWVRRVSAGNVATPWQPCDDNDDCFVYGSTSKRAIHLGIGPGYIAEPGSHLQFRVWISFNASNADNPEEASSMVSAWSPIYTVDRALAGVPKPPPPKHVPQITRINPAGFDFVPGGRGDWTINAYVRNACGPDFYPIFNSDPGQTSTVRMCSIIDADGSHLPEGLSRVVFDLPEGLRHPGDYSVMLHNPDGESNAVSFSVHPLPMTPVDRPNLPVVPQTRQTVPSGTVQPAPQVRPNPPRIILVPPRPN